MSHHNVVPDNYTYPFVLKACAKSASLEQGAQVHCRVIKSPHSADVYVECYLVDMYAKCRQIRSSRAVFDAIRRKNVFCWNMIIAGYVRHGDVDAAAEMFDEMPQRDLFSWNVMINGFSKSGEVESARRLFDDMKTRDAITWNSMIDCYVRSGDMEAAKKLFVEMPTKDAFTWGVILNGYATTAGSGVGMAHGLFEKLPYRNSITWNSLIHAYVRSNRIYEAWTLFESMGIRRRNSSSWNTMLYGLVKSGEVRVAEKLFEAMPVRDSISWNIMSVGYRENDESKKIIELYHSMTTAAARISADCATLAIALSAVGDMTLYDDGRRIHGYLKNNRIPTDGVVGVALIDMYFKCGYPDMAFETFHAISQESRTVDHWNGIITGAANHGLGTLAIKLFTKMVASSSPATVRPDEITFIALLKACNHAGLIQEGFAFFDLMSSKYGITPTVQHYGCLIDLLGRAGLLEEAAEIARNMPWKTNDVIWRSLLGSSRHKGVVEIAEICVERLVEMMPHDSSSYVLMSHVYGSTGQRESYGDVWKEMMKKGVVKKVPGFSSVLVESDF